MADEQSLRQRIVEAVTQHLSEQGRPPASVQELCQQLGIGEDEFYSLFPSLEAAESVFWTNLLERVITAVEAGEEWSEFNARQRLLAFFFAFSEESLAHRSLFLAHLDELGLAWTKPDFLRGFEQRFRTFGEDIVARGVATGEFAERRHCAPFYPGGFYFQFRSIIAFHLRDESEHFERTDAFIEKTSTLAFEMLRPQALDAAFDLARFLIPKWI